MKNTIPILLALLASAFVGVAATSTTLFGASRAMSAEKTPEGMIRHDVYFWLKDSATQADRARFEQGLRDFVAAVDTIARAEIGVPAATPMRAVVDHSFSYSLCVHFASIADHDAYQAHAAHQKFVDSFAGLWEKVKVYDSQLLIP